MADASAGASGPRPALPPPESLRPRPAPALPHPGSLLPRPAPALPHPESLLPRPEDPRAAPALPRPETLPSRLALPPPALPRPTDPRPRAEATASAAAKPQARAAGKRPAKGASKAHVCESCHSVKRHGAEPRRAGGRGGLFCWHKRHSREGERGDAYLCADCVHSWYSPKATTHALFSCFMHDCSRTINPFTVLGKSDMAARAAWLKGIANGEKTVPEEIRGMIAANLMQQCPHCHTLIQRIDGCDAVECSICRTTFHYLTGDELADS